jgi:hypothetical protein
VPLVVHSDGETEHVPKIGLGALQDALQQRHQLWVVRGMEVWAGHTDPGQSTAVTVATRSRPEMPSRVVIGPCPGTMSVSLVVAATENNARTAALSQ